MSRLRVYVAGAYSAPDVIAVRANMRRGLRLSVEVLQAGMAPFAPWLDFEFGLIADIQLQEYYDYSMAWLESAQAVLVCPIGAAQSKGTQAEIKRACELGIPVFWTLADLQNWAAKQNHFTISALPPGDEPDEMHGGLPARKQRDEVELHALNDSIGRCHCVRTKEEECCGK